MHLILIKSFITSRIISEVLFFVHMPAKVAPRVSLRKHDYVRVGTNCYHIIASQDNRSGTKFLTVNECTVRACQVGQTQISMHILEEAMMPRQDRIVYGDLARSGTAQTTTLDRYGETPPRHRSTDNQQLQLSLEHLFLWSFAPTVRRIVVEDCPGNRLRGPEGWPEARKPR